jgi:membrane-bound metal-dependent hydrolase YbcI (DUF457 family)
MPLPIAHALVGASIVAASRPNVVLSRDKNSLLLGAFLAILPDFDFFFVWVLGFGGSWHRSFTHSILFALASSTLAYTLAGISYRAERVAYALAASSHGLLDFITTTKMIGVELMWPFWTRRFKLEFFNYLDVDLNAHSFINFAIGLLKISLMELLILAPVFLLILFLKRS